MTRVKVCGLTRPHDAELAGELGAWAVGFICWPGSPRYVAAETIREIVDRLPASIEKVGVFVDQPVGHIRMVAESAGLTMIQLHGRESVAVARSIAHPVLKSVPIRAEFNPSVIAEIPEDITVLLDAYDPVRHGGTGRTVDWSVAATIAAQRRVVLAGGVNPDNAADAIRQVRPYALDLSSGVESAPGIKDPDKLRALFEAITHD